MRKNQFKSGLTLIEIIITVGILGMVSLLLLSVFSNGYMHIFNAGQDTTELFESQEAVETALASTNTGSAHTMTLEFPGYTMDVDGSIVSNESLTSFYPGVPEELVNVTGLTVAPPTVSIDGIGQIKLSEATIIPADATDKTVTWTSSDDSVAIVSDGIIEAVSAGTAVITARSINGISDTTIVTVTNTSLDTSLVNITFSTSGLTLNPSFDPDVLVYTAVFDKNNPPNVVGLPSDDSVTISYVQADNHNKTATITVTSDGSPTTTYTVTFVDE